MVFQRWTFPKNSNQAMTNYLFFRIHHSHKENLDA